MSTKNWIIGTFAVVIITLCAVINHPLVYVFMIGGIMISFGWFFSDARHNQKGWGYLNDNAGIYTGVKNYSKPECSCPGCGNGTGCCV